MFDSWDDTPFDLLVDDAAGQTTETTRIPEWADMGLSIGLIGAALSNLDPAGLDSLSKVRLMQAHARLVAHSQANLFRSMMAVVDEYEAMEDIGVIEAMEGAVAEVRAALRLTRRAAETNLDLACRLRDRLPEVLQALSRGDIDLPRARVIADGTDHLEADLAGAVSVEVLRRASELTTGQLRALVARLCIDLEPDAAVDRQTEALDGRAVVAHATERCTTTIVANDLPPERAAAAMNRLNRIAMDLAGADETRSLDQIRADVFLDLLEGTSVHGRRGVVDIRVDLTTLIGLDQRAADLNGFGPVISNIARQMAIRHGTSWRVAVTDGTGAILDTITIRRRPTATIRRQVESRDQTCVFPGCRMPATACDLDHREPVAEGGTTHVDQLVALCRHDHVIRHRHHWTHKRGGDGGHIWTSPLGMTYIRPPPV